MTKKDIIKYAMMISAIIVLCFGLLVYTLLPELSDFRNSIYGSIILYLAVTGIIVYLTLSKRINMPIIGKIIVWLYLLLYILLGIINLGKIEAMFFLIYSIINITVTIYIYEKTRIEYKSIWVFGALSYLHTSLFVLRVEYINGAMNLTLLIPTIIVTILVFIPCLIYGLSRYTLCKDLEKLICAPLLGLLLGFSLTWLTIGSMNVYLDTSKPSYEEYIIIDKDVRTGSRQITTYELEVKKEDVTFTIGVSEESYYDYEINDSIVLSRYSGAFNEPYYIHERITKE